MCGTKSDIGGSTVEKSAQILRIASASHLVRVPGGHECESLMWAAFYKHHGFLIKYTHLQNSLQLPPPPPPTPHTVELYFWGQFEVATLWYNAAESISR
jgi:hypothetical protein